jgi:hypothetical protein
MFSFAKSKFIISKECADNTQWEIGWLKVQEVILPNFVFELFIR